MLVNKKIFAKELYNREETAERISVDLNIFKWRNKELYKDYAYSGKQLHKNYEIVLQYPHIWQI